MSSNFTESVVEDAALAWLEALGYTVKHGPKIAPGEPASERSDFGEVILEGCLHTALQRLNPDLDETAIEEAIRKLRHPSHVSFLRNNHDLHHFLMNGVPLDIVREDGGHGVTVKVIDFENPNKNDWLAINQFTVIENKNNRRPDIVVFVNGLPLSVIELKKTSLVEDSPRHHLQLGHRRWGESFSVDRSPGHEPLPLRGDGSDPGLQTVGDYHQSVGVE